ncbi:TetR/AcrR family transcriptional regulator [Embleya sp. NBC_00896]|uniref:TetR/AcrR family transcriptional regulator n=1 Tax=Embleya sp. NBC_00896 TaxID=2975961 RepID=UPI0038659E47|nr:TetR/AcrR family transcriptional regulator [Embleya sp. NBC_00896]
MPTTEQAPRRIPSGDRAAGKRKAILKAATDAFLREGYGVGMDTIAAEAGVAKVTVYNHFGSKEALFTAIVGEILERALAESTHLIEERLGSSTDVRADLTAICEAWVAGHATPEVLTLHNVVMGSMPRLPDLGRTWRELGPDRFHVVVRTALGELVERGELAIDDVPLAAMQLSGLVLLPHIAYGSAGAVPDADLTARLITGGVDMFLARYGPTAASRPDVAPGPPGA